MPRIANNTDALLRDLMIRLEKLVETARAEGRDEALARVRDLVGGEVRPRGRPVGSGNSGPKKPRKNPWANMTPEQKKARVRKMLAGRGLKPKDER